MSNYWSNTDIPHKGWILVDVIDIREDGQPASETEYENCMMCGNEKIRYVHIVEHKEIDDSFRVGCVCASKMTEDYVNPEKRERELRNRSNRRISWIKRKWKTSQNGNIYLNINNHHILIFKDIKSNKYKVKIKDQWGKKSFDNIDQAKIAAFNGIEYYKEIGEW